MFFAATVSLASLLLPLYIYIYIAEIYIYIYIFLRIDIEVSVTDITEIQGNVIPLDYVNSVEQMQAAHIDDTCDPKVIPTVRLITYFD